MLLENKNENFNYVLNRCKEYLSVHIGRLDTAISKKESMAIVTLKIPFLTFTEKIIDFLNEAKDRVQNIMIFAYGGKELAVKIAVDYFDSGESELQKAANKLVYKGE